MRKTIFSHTLIKKIFKLSFIILSVTALKTASAENLKGLFEHSEITGNLRAYYVRKDYMSKSFPSNNIFSINGQINLLTGELVRGWKLGASIYFAQSLKVTEANQFINKTRLSFNNITFNQLYLQYANEKLLIKIGNQVIDTPWLNPSNTVITPTSYQSIYVTYKPEKNLKLIGLRTFDFNDKFCDSFAKINLYNTGSLGYIDNKDYKSLSNKGVLAFGVQYKISDINSQIWYYHFHDLARLLYIESIYQPNTINKINPIIGIQYVKEWGSESNFLKPYAKNTINASAYGFLVGAKSENLQLTLGYNYISQRKNSLYQGNILSPYTAGSDPLYTSSFMGGMIERDSSHAVKLSGTYFALDKQLQLSASYAKYFSSSSAPNLNEVNFEAIYSFSDSLKGLSVRYRAGVLMGNKSTGTNIYNRVMLQYSF